MTDNKYVFLVNKENSIPNIIFNLITTNDINDQQILIEEETYNQYVKLKDCVLRNEKILIGIGNSYRTAEVQKELYEEFIIRYGKEYANAIVAPVNHSEHQTGLAIDLNLYFEGEGFIHNNDNFDRISIVFEEHIHKYLSKFGFILRYPKDKSEITKYPYEPWHIRYIGEKVAKEIDLNNITLEEYMEN